MGCFGMFVGFDILGICYLKLVFNCFYALAGADLALIVLTFDLTINRLVWELIPVSKF